jgi:hypothetical protein
MCEKTCLWVLQEIEAILGPRLGAKEESLKSLGGKDEFSFGFFCCFILAESSYLQCSRVTVEKFISCSSKEFSILRSLSVSPPFPRQLVRVSSQTRESFHELLSSC